MIRINPQYICSPKDEEIVGEWIMAPGNEIIEKVEKKLTIFVLV